MNADAQHDHPGESRPWEQPGVVRRDCAPHRGHVLVALGRASLVCGILSLCLALPALVGFPLGLVARVLAERDLVSMRAGVMDPRGRAQTERARRLGQYGATLSAISPLVFMVLWVACGQAIFFLRALLG